MNNETSIADLANVQCEEAYELEDGFCAYCGKMLFVDDRSCSCLSCAS